MVFGQFKFSWHNRNERQLAVDIYHKLLFEHIFQYVCQQNNNIDTYALLWQDTMMPWLLMLSSVLLQQNSMNFNMLR